jgi:multicomponent Na+:H+ antiporter subunit G
MIAIFAYLFIFLGCFFCVTGVLGCFRFPDYFSKMHAASITDNFGCPLILLGVMINSPTLLSALKILLLILLMLIINPTSSYLVNRYAYNKDKEN